MIALMRIQSKVHPLRRQWKLILGCGLMGLLTLLGKHYRLSMAVGESMLPTLNTGDLFLIDQKLYQNAEPKRGDIVVVGYQKDLIVKAIGGLPGEEDDV